MIARLARGLRWAMAVQTKRWDDPIEPATDGTRILVTRYRPRGLAKADETWSEWMPAVAPSRDLHAAAYGKRGLQISWEGYRAAYLREMQSQHEEIAGLARRVVGGETITLLCSSQCDRESRCHRNLLKTLIEREANASIVGYRVVRRAEADYGDSNGMNVIAKILTTLVLAVATLVANATCVCARAAVARGPHACCLRAVDGNGSGGHPATAKCGQCHASALTAGERDASPISFAIAPMPTFESLLYVAVPAPRLAARSLAAPPPADVLERRHVIQV